MLAFSSTARNDGHKVGATTRDPVIVCHKNNHEALLGVVALPWFCVLGTEVFVCLTKRATQ